MAWHLDYDKPLYLQIADFILLDILGGKYKQGEKLPSVREWAIEVSVNPNTMQRAFTQLETVGLIDTQATNGRFVTTDESAIRAARERMAFEIAANFVGHMQKLGYTPEEAVKFVSKMEGGDNTYESDTRV